MRLSRYAGFLFPTRCDALGLTWLQTRLARRHPVSLPVYHPPAADHLPWMFDIGSSMFDVHYPPFSFSFSSLSQWLGTGQLVPMNAILSLDEVTPNGYFHIISECRSGWE